MKFKIDKRLKYCLDLLVSDINDRDDAVVVIVGEEGAGKSVLASQIARYWSIKTKTKLNINNVSFDGQAYMDFSLASPKKIINWLDESRRALNKMRASSGSNQDFMNFLSECRSQNQGHLILLPGFSDLDRYVAVHRVKLIIWVKKSRHRKTGKLIRGKYNIYKTKSKSLLEMAWKGKYKMPPIQMLFAKDCKFSNVFAIDEKAYDEKKEEAKKDRYSSKKEEGPSLDEKINKVKEIKEAKKTKKWAEIAEEFDFTSPDAARMWFSNNRRIA